MIANISKIIAASGLLALSAALATAGGFSINTGSGGFKSGIAVVPSAGSCGQVCYSGYYYSWSEASGPLGHISLTGFNGTSGNPQYTQRSGPVAPGNYGCYVNATNGGYAVVTITW